MPSARISIIIPTFNRRETLEKCLQALAAQTEPREAMEVIVVDDGSADGTPRAAREFLDANFPNGMVLEGTNRGPAHARNRGMEAATSPVILLLGDDMIAAPGLVAEHLAWHGSHPADHEAVLGLVEWHPEVEMTPLMDWIEREDRQFDFRRLRHGQEVDFWHFYSSNVSFKRRFVMSHPLFDTDFPFAAFEDVEFGHRLQKRGLRILHNRNAVTYHLHPMTLEGFCRRSEHVGRSLSILLDKAPELDPDGRMARSARPRIRHSVVLLAYPILSRVFPPARGLLRRKYFRARAHQARLEGFRRGGRSPAVPQG